MHQLYRRHPTVFVVKRRDDDAKIPLKSSRLLCVDDGVSAHRHQPRQRIVAFATLKLIAKRRRPVLVSGFIAINEQMPKASPKQGAEMLLERANNRIPVILGLIQAHFISFEHLTDLVVRYRVG